MGEDDPTLRHAALLELKRSGLSVTSCGTGLDLVEAVSATLLDNAPMPFDVIVADVRMPGLSGLAFLAGVRDLGYKVPVILITALSDDETDKEAMRLKAAAVFSKPFDLEILVEVVQNLCPSPLVLGNITRSAEDAET